MNEMTAVRKSSPKDWETDQEVRWCPGCGDYAILKAVQRTLPQIGANPAQLPEPESGHDDGSLRSQFKSPQSEYDA